METGNLISVCRLCQNYTPEGHRGGHCQLLEVSVKGSWKSCQMAIPAFAPSWEAIENLITLQVETPLLREVFPVDHSLIEVSELNTSDRLVEQPVPSVRV